MKKIILGLFISVLIGLFVTSCDRSNSSTDEAEVQIPVEIETVKLGNVIQSLR